MKRPRGTGGINVHGYMQVQGRHGYLEHRRVIEENLGRPLEPWEHVHHLNGVRSDNRPENLELWAAPSKAPGMSKRQPNGQRVEDLVAFVVEHYPEQVMAALAKVGLVAT
jgi:HNH endonuclease